MFIKRISEQEVEKQSKNRENCSLLFCLKNVPGVLLFNHIIKTIRFRQLYFEILTT